MPCLAAFASSVGTGGQSSIQKETASPPCKASEDLIGKAFSPASSNSKARRGSGDMLASCARTGARPGVDSHAPRAAQAGEQLPGSAEARASKRNVGLHGGESWPSAGEPLMAACTACIAWILFPGLQRRLGDSVGKDRLLDGEGRPKGCAACEKKGDLACSGDCWKAPSCGLAALP